MLLTRDCLLEAASAKLLNYSLCEFELEFEEDCDVLQEEKRCMCKHMTDCYIFNPTGHKVSF